MYRLMIILVGLCLSAHGLAAQPLGKRFLHLEYGLGLMFPHVTGNEWSDVHGRYLIPVDLRGVLPMISFGVYARMLPIGDRVSIVPQANLEVGGEIKRGSFLSAAVPLLGMIKYGGDGRPALNISPGFGLGVGYCFRYVDMTTQTGSRIHSFYGAPVLAIEISSIYRERAVLKLRYVQTITPIAITDHASNRTGSNKFVGDVEISSPTLCLSYTAEL